MASAFTHAIAGLAIGTAFRRPGPPVRFWVLGAIGAVIPDLDAVGFWLGVPYDSVFGHRGITHSLTFAALFASAALAAFRSDAYDGTRRRIWLYLFLATASHGAVDAMTSGGGGIAFFAPFVNDRYFFPWRPILVSPLSIGRFFTQRGVAILVSEAMWVWLPAAVFALVMTALRRRDSRTQRVKKG
jgi:inner membrane protein